MGWWDDLLAKSKKKAAQETGKAAARQAVRAASAAVGGLADSFLDFAEGELEEARAKREGKHNPVSHLTEGGEAPEIEDTIEDMLDDSPEEQPTPQATEPDSPPPEDPHAGRPPAVRARLEREERARRELEELKRQMSGDKPDGPVKKTL